MQGSWDSPSGPSLRDEPYNDAIRVLLLKCQRVAEASSLQPGDGTFRALTLLSWWMVWCYPWGNLSYCHSYPDLHLCRCNYSVSVKFWWEDGLLIRLKPQTHHNGCSLGRSNENCCMWVLSWRDLMLVYSILSFFSKNSKYDLLLLRPRSWELKGDNLFADHWQESWYSERVCSSLSILTIAFCSLCSTWATSNEEIPIL